MGETYCYYIMKNGYMGEKIKLPFGIKIWKYKTTLPYFPMFSDVAQGPYSTLELLEEISPIMQELKEKYSKNQFKVLFEDKNIPELTNIVLFPSDKSYSLDLVHMITHGLKGDINRNTATGGHFLDPDKVRIVKLLETDSKGVIRAKIEIFDHKQHKWIPKKVTTTLFPKAWSLQKYVNECRHCMENKIHVEGDIYTATTKCGIETIIILENGKVVTFYPKFKK